MPALRSILVFLAAAVCASLALSTVSVTAAASADGCVEDALKCPDDGPVLARDPALNCEFPPCPTPAAAFALRASAHLKLALGAEAQAPAPDVCTDDARLCPDGTVVERAPHLNCAFPSCPSPAAGTAGGDTAGTQDAEEDNDDSDGDDLE